MAGWARAIRAVIGTGVTFAAGVGGAVAVVGSAMWLAHGVTPRELAEMVAKFTVASFALGVVFAGALALAARARPIKRLSLGLAARLGAAAGFVYWVFLAFNGGRAWTLRLAAGNLVVLLAMGAGAATATVWLARRGRSALDAAEDSGRLSAGDDARYSPPPERERGSAVGGNRPFSRM